ncbi:Oidioi.mRNA.OKI2018_I69.chr2.g4379.t1.cds [Oikopleura dioica]|uniref:One cut domain family member n=1 Tax=Oikopleura dioica TaxID=34765 RepID=A0ABN7T684_OIKDI|nr:Oidioi.mRNA.OKI2018_I69.chr2.g4379.t1.cds [Oikopleura dioica]
MIELSYIPTQPPQLEPSTIKTENFSSYLPDFQEIKEEAFQSYDSHYVTAFPVQNTYASFTPDYGQIYTPETTIQSGQEQNRTSPPLTLAASLPPPENANSNNVDQTKIFLQTPQTQTYIATSIPEGAYTVFEEIPTDFSNSSNSNSSYAYPISLSINPPTTDMLPQPTFQTSTPDHQHSTQSSNGLPMDTKKVAEDILSELKRYSIPQSVFANKILGRSQGTLSDLLRNPKPWDKLKAGRETFRRMEQWLQQPEMKRVTELQQATRLAGSMKQQQKDLNLPRQKAKKIRRIFTDSQRRVLHNVFKTNNRPTKEHQMALAEELNLELSTVSNFFMNARRRRLSPV